MAKDNKDLNTISEEASDNKKTKKKSNGGIKKLFTSRKFKKGGFAVAVTAVFIVAVVVLNMIAVMATHKVQMLSLDLSEKHLYDLSQDTIDYLQTVDQEITVTVLASKAKFSQAEEHYKVADTLINQMHNTNKKITIKYVDLTANPTFVNKYENETLYGGEFIVSCGEKYRVLSFDDLFQVGYSSDYTTEEIQDIKVEPAVTTAILNVTSENQIKVQFIDGFGEYYADAFKKLLEQNNYDVSTVSTLTEEIASDTQAIVLYAPTVDLDENSVKKIKDFLNNNGEYGKNLIYFSHHEKTDTPNLDALIEEWGMKLGDGLIMENDFSKLPAPDPLIFVADYNNAEYTEGLKDATLSIVAGYSRPVEITNTNIATSLVVSSAEAKVIPFDVDESFIIEDVAPAQYNAAAVASKVSGEEGIASNVVVFGSSYLSSESIISIPSYNNGSYLVNTVNKITDNQDEGIAISGKDLTNPSLGITTDQIYSWAVVCVGVIPVIIVIVAIIIWVRRRNK